MDNNTQKNDKSNILIVISIIILLFIIGYIIYLMKKDVNLLNINELDLKNIESNYNNNNNAVLPIAQKEIVYTEKEISSYTSTLYDNQQSRIFNINKACEIINNKIVEPNEEFSFNETIGPMNEAYGFKKATGFDSDGNLIQIPGGGMCQISSTLYNAVMLANLEVTERHAHSRRVNYVPADKDATIYYPTLDFKFLNNTDSRIKILASTDDYSITITLIKIEQSN